MAKLGLCPKDVKAHDMVNPYKMPEWDDMTVEEKAKSARAMEVYAAMVEQLDENVGRLLNQLEKDGEMDNTFILFMSDNAAEGSSYEVYPSFGPSLMQTIDKYYNNDLENIGEADSFVWYGNFWAQASTAPGWLYKMYTSQGGIRVPFILRYPPLFKAREFKEWKHHRSVLYRYGSLTGPFWISPVGVHPAAKRSAERVQGSHGGPCPRQELEKVVRRWRGQNT